MGRAARALMRIGAAVAIVTVAQGGPAESAEPFAQPEISPQQQAIAGAIASQAAVQAVDVANTMISPRGVMPFLPGLAMLGVSTLFFFRRLSRIIFGVARIATKERGAGEDEHAGFEARVAARLEELRRADGAAAPATFGRKRRD